MLICVLENNARSRAGIDKEIVGIASDFERASQLCLEYVILESSKIPSYIIKQLVDPDYRKKYNDSFMGKNWKPSETTFKVGKTKLLFNPDFSDAEANDLLNKIKQHLSNLKTQFLSSCSYNPKDVDTMNELLSPFLSKIGVARRFFTINKIEMDKATNSLE